MVVQAGVDAALRPLSRSARLVKQGCNVMTLSSLASALGGSFLLSSFQQLASAPALLATLAPLLHSSPRKTLSPKVSVVTEQQIQPHLQFMRPKNLKGNQNFLHNLSAWLYFILKVNLSEEWIFTPFCWVCKLLCIIFTPFCWVSKYVTPIFNPFLLGQ